jgi:hypothetical protein
MMLQPTTTGPPGARLARYCGGGGRPQEGVDGLRRFARGGEQAEAPTSVHYTTRRSVYVGVQDHHIALEENTASTSLLHECQNESRPKLSCADHQFVLYQTTLTSRQQAKQSRQYSNV